VERVLPSPEVKARIASLAVGLAADCDAPEDAVEELMRAHLGGATMLPFAGFVTHDGKWVGGFSGNQDAAAFAGVLASAEKSPLLDATAAVRKQLEKPAKTATAAAARGDWKSALGAVREAGKSTGRCPERDRIKAADRQAREWAAAQFAAAVEEAGSGGDLAPARKRLAEIKRHFAGEPEAAEAELGSKAVQRLTQIRDAETLPNPARDLRDKAAAMFQGTRWAAIFVKPANALRDQHP
jgi:hypothetical protein